MIWHIAFRNIFRYRLRSTVTVLGLAIAVALLTNMLMLSTGMRASLYDILTTLQYELRVCPPGTLPFTTEAEIHRSGEVAARIAEERAIDRTLRVLGASVYAAGERTGAGEDATPRATFAIGIEGDRPLIFKVLEGDAIDTRAAADVSSPVVPVLINATIRDEFALSIGDTLLVSRTGTGGLFRTETAARCIVTGVVSFHFDLPEQRSIAVHIRALQRITGKSQDPASFLMAKLHNTEDDVFVSDREQSGVRERLGDALPSLSVYSIEDFMQRLLGNLAYFQQFSIILGSISILVTFLLVSVVLVIGVNEKRGEIAAMRSIGFRRRTLQSIVIMESAILIGASSALGVVAGIPLANYLNDLLVASPGIPDTFDFFVANPRAIATALLIAITTGLAAAVYPAVHTTRIDIVRTMHEEIL